MHVALSVARATPTRASDKLNGAERRAQRLPRGCACSLARCRKRRVALAMGTLAQCACNSTPAPAVSLTLMVSLTSKRGALGVVGVVAGNNNPSTRLRRLGRTPNACVAASATVGPSGCGHQSCSSAAAAPNCSSATLAAVVSSLSRCWSVCLVGCSSSERMSDLPPSGVYLYGQVNQ